MGFVTVEVVEASSLPALDKSGTSDPYVVVTIGSKHHKTSVKEKNVNPVWKEKLTFPAPTSSVGTIQFSVMDKEKVGSDQHIGDATLQDPKLSAGGPALDQWLTLSNPKAKSGMFGRKKGSDSSSQGQLHVTVTFSDDEPPPAEEKKKKLPFLKKQSENKEQAEEEEDALMPIEMPSGDYQIQVHIHEARDLKGREAGGTSDPICFVKVLDKKQHTDKKEKTLSCVWDHLMFFEFKNAVPEELEFGRVSVGVFDANSIRPNVLIGTFELDLAYVYQQPGHELYKKWVALSDTTDEHEGIQGYLQLSVAVLGPGDELPTHDEKDDKEGDSEDISKMVLMPPRIKEEGHLMVVRVHEGEDMPKLDKFGECDPFVAVEFGGNPPCKSQVQKETLNPIWNDELQIPVVLPSMADRARLTVYDWERAGKNEVVGTHYFRFSKLTKASKEDGVQKPSRAFPTWVNLYGAPHNVSNDVARKMNQGLIEGTTYRGRVLLTSWRHPDDEPKLEVERFDAVERPAEQPMVVRVDLMEGSEFPFSEGKSAQIEVCFGPERVMSKSQKLEGGRMKFYEQLEELEMACPLDAHQIPDVFVYLVYDGDRVAYKRHKAADLLGKGRMPPLPDPSPSEAEWHSLEEDKVLDKIPEGEIPGFALYRISLNTKDAQMSTERLPVVEPETTRYVLLANIYQGKELPATDDDGTLDPYVIVRCAGQKKKLPMVEKSCFPIWNQTVSMEVDLPPLDISPRIHCLVYDHDKYSKDDFIGRFMFPITACQEERPDRPSWHELTLENEPVQGALLCSFQLLPAGFAGSPIPPIRPPSDMYTVDIILVGLRDVEPFLGRISSPYCEFDLGNRSSRELIRVTKPSANPTSRNPNYLQCITFDCNMPRDPIYSPAISIGVRDKRFGGARRPLLGNGYIELAEIFGKAVNHDMDDTCEMFTPRGVNKKRVSTTRISLAAIKQAAAEQSAPSGSDDVVIDIPSTPHLHDVPDLPSIPGGKAKYIELKEAVEESGTIDDLEDDTPAYMKGRLVHDDELESLIEPLPFTDYEFYRGNSLKKEGLGGLKLGGKLKAHVRVYPKNQLPPNPGFDTRDLFVPKQYVVRVYILRGINLMAKDTNGKADPFIHISLGKQEISDRDNYCEATLQPEFYKCYEIKAMLPGSSSLHISVLDWDKVGGNDLIGSTTVDLENRWFNDKWLKMCGGKAIVPLERRTLWNPAAGTAQGKLEMWVEIMTPARAAVVSPVDISPPPKEKFEVRTVIWKTRDIPSMDTITNQNDLYLTGELIGCGKQETDIHWRAKKGIGSFNYRLKWEVELPMKDPRFQIAAWDQDLIARNDNIAETTISLKRLFTRAYKSKTVQGLIPEKQWLPLRHPNYEGPRGEVEVSIEVVPLNMVELRPAGPGRSEPNMNPVLPKPIRISFNFFRPDLMCLELLGPELCMKFKGVFICLCCCMVVGVLVVFMGQFASIVNMFK